MNVYKEQVTMPDLNIPIRAYVYDEKQGALLPVFHEHIEFEIVYILNGSIDFYINDQVIRLKSKEVIIINPAVPHAVTFPESTARHLLLQFKLTDIFDMTGVSDFKYLSAFILGKNKDFSVMNGENTEFKKVLLSIVKEYSEKKTAYEIAVKALLYQMMTLLFRSDIITPTDIGSFASVQDLEKIHTALRYIEKNYDKPVSLAELCEISNYEYHYFCRLFRRCTGKTFVQYLNFIRLHVARRLILTTDHSITDIAVQSGYGNFSYFNRMFKAQFGQSPSVYRKNTRKNIL